MVPSSSLAAPQSVSGINANPQILNGLTFRKGNLEGLNVKNVHIKGMTFDDIQAERSTFVNVTFENCTFTKTNFRNSHFENVAFKGCTLQGEGDPEDVRNTTIFQYTTFKNILFENTKLKHTWIVDIEGDSGYIYFRNMHDVFSRSADAPLIVGSNVNIRITDSNLKNIILPVDSTKNSLSFYARNSSFADFDLRSNRMYFESCQFTKGTISSQENLIVKDSVVAVTSLLFNGIGYLINNTYPTVGEPYTKPSLSDFYYYPSSKILGSRDGQIHLLHKDKAPAYIGFDSGNITIRDIILKQPLVWNNNPKNPLSSFNLKNVHFLGGVWDRITIEKGKWENVTIDPVFMVRRARISGIHAYNLQFPKGEPWRKEGEFAFDVTKTGKPFEWEEVHVPTPEELGLEWWPSEPGYHPDKNS